MNRILASAQAVMAGLFSSERQGLDIPAKENSSTWPSHWIPVPVHAPRPYTNDREVFRNFLKIDTQFHSCPKEISICEDNDRDLSHK